MSLTPKLLQQGAAGSARANYIEDVFSTYLYSGSASTQTVTNGIDLSTKGGLVWIKVRNDTLNNILFDTARGDFELISNSTAAQANNSRVFVPLSTGFSLGGGENVTNNTPNTYVSWTFRKQAKFFDVVTYTGNGTAGRQISHALGSVPGCILVKKTSGTDAWAVYHRGLNSGTGNGLLVLNTTTAQNTNGRFWWGDNTNFIAPTSTNFTVSNDGQVNASGATYVAYLFAHNAGGFGLTGSDNVITCGSATNDSSGNWTATLGYEPQWVLWRDATISANWEIIDSMRGMSVTDNQRLFASLSNAEGSAGGPYLNPKATGMQMVGSSGSAGGTTIYIAIRRGPMKVPTTGTSVFTPATRSATGAVATVTGVGFPPDLYFSQPRQSNRNPVLTDRLRGATKSLSSRGTYAEQTETGSVTAFGQDGVTLGANNADFFNGVNDTGFTFANWNFRRAPGFFDIVCYTGTGSGTQTISHNLGVTPELTINKSRSGTRGWTVYYNNTTFLRLNETNAGASESLLSPTSTTFNADLGAGFGMNAAETYVTYLFASCPGVSKVGSYTGNGSSQTIDCGFAAGARFVLIKRTNATGDWYTFDTARGIIAGNDPFLKINSTAAETTSYDAVDPANAGFIVNNDDTNYPINVASATYIFLAIA